MKLLLIRHGDPDYTHDSLTEKGQREAELLCRRLEKLDVKEWFVSPLGRAQATIRPLLEKTGRSAVTIPWMREFPLHGYDVYTKTDHVVWDYYPKYRERHPEWDSAGNWMDASPFKELGARSLVEEMWDGLDAILAGYGYVRDGLFYRAERPNRNTIGLVCHFGAATILLSHLLNVSAMQLLHTTFMAPTAITAVLTEERERGTAQWRTTVIGDVSHLDAAGEPMSMSGFFQETFE